MFRAGPIPGPFSQVTVAPAFPARFRSRVQAVAAVSWAMKSANGGSVAVQRPVGLPLVAAVSAGETADVGVGRALASKSGPTVVEGITLIVILRVHDERKPDLPLVAVTLSLEPFPLGPGQRGQQHR